MGMADSKRLYSRTNVASSFDYESLDSIYTYIIV